jgi:hypothetical protein
MYSISGTPTSGRISNNADPMQTLSVSETHDVFDFVLIETDEGSSGENHRMEDGNDDDSYDYCEDAFSVLSCEEDSYDSDFIDMRESILSVADILMKDLDEAHAAAKLVKFDEELGPRDVEERVISSSPSRKSDQYSTASSVVSMEGDDDIEDSLPSKEKQDSSLLFSTNSKHHGMLQKMETPLVRCSDDEKLSSIESTKKMNGEQPHRYTSAGDDGPWANTKEGNSSTSRTSNKKRRKKLKLLKKAQAAASAAMKLEENKRPGTTTVATTLTSSSKNSKALIQQSQANQKVKSRTSKKVGNIAVACATETIAAYRKELLLRRIK